MQERRSIVNREQLSDIRYAIDNLRDAIDRGSLILAEHYCERLERVLRELDPARETVATMDHFAEPNRNGDGR
jgi:hypothetical protein